MSIPRMGLAAAAIGSKIYATGGFLGDAGQPPLTELYTREVEIYDTAKDEWSIGTPMIHNRSSHGAGAVSGKVYVMGGTDYIVMSPPGALVSTEEYDPVADKWEYKSSMLTPRSRFGTAVVDGKIYTIGGWWTPVMGIWTKSNATEAYDPATDTWTRLSRMPTARGEVALAVLDRKIYAMGGSGGWDVIEIYDVDTDTWTTGPSIPSNATSYYGMTAEVLDGRIYLMGGVGMDCVKSVVVSYDPAADEWRWEPVMNYARSDHASVTIGNAIYVMGGTYGWMCGNRAPAERFVGMSELDYEWDFDANVDSDGDGNYTNDVDATGEAPTHVYGDNGNYTVTLKVTDNAGLSDTDTCLITVLNVPPTADANGPYQGFEGTPIHFNGSQTDPGANDTHTYEWDFNYDGTTFTPDATGNPNQKTWHDDYTGSIALKVTDDDGGWDLDVTTVTIVNVPPRAEAGEDKEGYEASTFIFNGSFYDPGSNDTHECAWDFDYDGISFDVEATGQSVSHTFVDDFDGEIALRVTDDDGGVGIDTAHVLVKNVPPTVTLEVLPIEVDAFLRIAGEKWHDVSIELYEDGILMANGTLVRYPGSPDDQMLDLSSLKFDHSMKYSATIRYTPDDDPINGQPNGANPCWIILRFSDGQELWIHHTFNVQHPDTYVWEVDLTAAILSHGMTFEAIAFDPGADELTFHWDFGDGTNATSFYPNGNGTCPVTITEIINHIFPGSGTYVVVLTVEDDDGGVGTASLTIVIP
jgi:N-acetylneuraminic acid mutarotase